MGLINIYNTVSNEHRTIKGNGKLKDILCDVKFTKCIVIKEGTRLNENYSVTENDVLYCRCIPTATTTVGIVLAVVAVVAAGAAIGYSVYQANKAKQEQEKAQRNAKNLADSTEKLPFLKGSQNKTALGNPIQYVIGETYNSPYKLTDGYYSIDGKDGCKQYWTTVLSAGYTGQLIEKLYCGNQIIKEWSDSTPQSGSYGFNEGSIYYDKENLVEITQNGTFQNNFFRQKSKGKAIYSEIKNDYDSNRDSKKEYVIEQLEDYTQKVEVCVEFSSLRQYNIDSESWEEKSVTVTPEWSNDGGSTWHEFSFNQCSEAWIKADSAKKAELIDEGKLYEDPLYHFYVSLDDNIKVDDGNVYYKTTNGSNIIQRNSRSTIRFIATKEFSAAEAYGKTLTVRLSRSMKAESNTQEDCYLAFINCFCYDNEKSSATNLVECKTYEKPEQLTMLGLRFISNSSTEGILNEFNVISYATAPAITQNGFGSKTTTRNLISWVADILLSNTHPHSQFKSEELDINSFYSAYQFCETNKYYVDGIITSSIKKRDLLTKLLSLISATLFWNTDGKLEIAIDKVESTPVALLNSETIKAVTYAKDLSRKADGIKLTFTNRASWSLETRYAMLDGDTTHSADDILLEKNIELVTEPDFIYKIGQRALREQNLQPMMITADVGREGDYYPLYSLILVQLPQLRQGLASSVISGLIKNSNGEISGIKIQDRITFDNEHRFGVVIQAITSTGSQLYYREVIGSGTTRILTFSEVITGSVVPTIGNPVSIGYLDSNGGFDKVTQKMKIYGITKSGTDGVQLSLKPYNPALYETGDIPSYKSNLTSVPEPAKTVPSVTPEKLQQSIDNIRTITNVITYYALTETSTAPQKSAFTTTVQEMTQTKRFLWTYTKYEYKDGTAKDTSIVLSGVYGAQGAAGSGYRLDISPDSISVFSNSSGAASVESVQFGVYFFIDTTDISSDTTFSAYINDSIVGTWSGPIVTIPTSNLTADTTQIKIVAQYQSIQRTSYASVTKVYGNTIYQLLPSTQNIKIQGDRTVTPSLVTITRQKITAGGYYQASEDEGVIYGRVVPGGELTKIGYYKVQSSDNYDASKQYCTEFEPFMLSVDSMPGSGEDIVIGTEDSAALIFYTRT